MVHGHVTTLLFCGAENDRGGGAESMLWSCFGGWVFLVQSDYRGSMGTSVFWSCIESLALESSRARWTL